MGSSTSNQDAATTPAVESSKETGSGKASKITPEDIQATADAETRAGFAGMPQATVEQFRLATLALRVPTLARVKSWRSAYNEFDDLAGEFAVAHEAHPSANVLSCRSVTIVSAASKTRASQTVTRTFGDWREILIGDTPSTSALRRGSVS